MFYAEYNSPIYGDIYRKNYRLQEEILNKDDIDILQINDLHNTNIVINYRNVTELELNNCNNCIITIKDLNNLKSLYINNCKDDKIVILEENISSSITILSSFINELIIKNGSYNIQIENTKINQTIFENVKLIHSEIIN